MYLQQDWRPGGEPPPPPRGKPLSDGDERMITWAVVAIGVSMLVAPIGRATLVEAVVAALR